VPASTLPSPVEALDHESSSGNLANSRMVHQLRMGPVDGAKWQGGGGEFPLFVTQGVDRIQAGSLDRTREGTLKGSDVDWQSYRVVAGHAIGLILNNEELLWLRKVWAEATSN